MLAEIGVSAGGARYDPGHGSIGLPRLRSSQLGGYLRGHWVPAAAAQPYGLWAVAAGARTHEHGAAGSLLTAGGGAWRRFGDATVAASIAAYRHVTPPVPDLGSGRS